uniref:Uncharacterized protein n=1 Tax=Octopus bimaculoides TaxID=37653 RepID=A0A0L8HB08_OCTBM
MYIYVYVCGYISETENNYAPWLDRGIKVDCGRTLSGNLTQVTVVDCQHFPKCAVSTFKLLGNNFCDWDIKIIVIAVGPVILFSSNFV